MLGHLLLQKVSVDSGEKTSLEPQVGAQSDPEATETRGHYKHSYTHLLSMQNLYYISGMPIFPGTNANQCLDIPLENVPLCCLTKASESISCRMIKTTHILAASLPGGPYLAWISSLVSFTSTQRLWSWVPQSPWPLEEVLGIPLGHMLPRSRGLQWGNLSGINTDTSEMEERRQDRS